MARVWSIFRRKSASFSAAVGKTEFGPPRLRSGSQIAHSLVAIGLQTQEICYPGRLAVQIGLWLVNGAYVGRNWPSNSRNTLSWPPSIDSLLSPPFRLDAFLRLTSPSASFYLVPFPPHPLSFLPLLFLVPLPTILRLLPSNPPIRVRIRIRIL